MKTLLIVWHSQTGGTEQMAHAAAQNALTETSLHVHLMHARDTRAEDVLKADGLIFATPENLAAISGMMKDFFDRTYYALLDRVNGKPYAAMICAGSDGSNALRQIERIALGLRLKPIAEGLIVNIGAQTTQSILAAKTVSSAELSRCAELGHAMAAGLAAGIF